MPAKAKGIAHGGVYAGLYGIAGYNLQPGRDVGVNVLGIDGWWNNAIGDRFNRYNGLNGTRRTQQMPGYGFGGAYKQFFAVAIHFVNAIGFALVAYRGRSGV